MWLSDHIKKFCQKSEKGIKIQQYPHKRRRRHETFFRSKPI